MSRPGGNVTGVTILSVEVGQKLLELLHESVPAAVKKTVGTVLVAAFATTATGVGAATSTAG